MAAKKSAYEALSNKANEISTNNSSTGWAYIISGGVSLAASIPGYYLSNDVFAKVVYSVGETMGVAAIGYGSYLVLLENDYTRFKQIIDGVPELKPTEKEKLALLFMRQSAERARNVRKIRTISHSLTAALNFLNAFTAENEEFKNALFFIGGINVLAALSFGLTKSEEEKAVQSFAAVKPGPSPTVVAGVSFSL